MSSSLKPIKVWGNAGPNPPKVAIILDELDLPYELIPISFPDLKKPEFLAINPNGRMPAIYDPNTDLTLWESGAIVEYLVERYDTKHKLSFPTGSAEYYHAKQWLFFQVSGQGPYYGQAIFFKRYHSEHLPSAIARYTKEINRVSSVLESHLAKQKASQSSADGPWLVGDKMSYADMAFIMWQGMLSMGCSKEEYDPEAYPQVKMWLEKMGERESVKGAWKRTLEAYRAQNAARVR